MNNSIVTDENNPLVKEPILADFWMRFGAFFIDVLALKGISFLISNYYPTPNQNLANEDLVLMLFFYFSLTEGIFSKTPGMACLGLKIINSKTAKRINIFTAAARTFGRFLCLVTVGVGYLIMLINKKHQGLQDLIASTLVVYYKD